MFLLTYRSSKHEATGVISLELYFARDLRLPLDLVQGSSLEIQEIDSSTVQD